MEIKNYSINEHAQLTAYLQSTYPDQELPAILIVPGGSMTHIPIESSEKTALRFNALGFQAFVLRYTFLNEQQPLLPQPILDLAAAVIMVKMHREEWRLNNQLTLLGFSAGGLIVSLYNDYWDSTWLTNQLGTQSAILKPSNVILGYPVIDLDLGFPNDVDTLHQWTNDPEFYSASHHVTDTNVPTFLWATMDDPLITVQNTINYSLALHAHQIPHEVHLFQHGPHGMTIANSLAAKPTEPDHADPHVAHWIDLASEWLQFLT